MTMNSYATASADSKDIACLQSYHRGGFVDYSRLYQPPQSSTTAYLDQYRLQQSAYPSSVGDHAASGPYSVAVGGKTTTSAGYDQAAVGYGFFDLQETFRRDQWSLLGSAVQDGTGGLKRLDSGGEKTAVTRPCGGTGGDGERSAAAVQGVAGAGGIGALADSVQIKCEDGVRPTHRPETSISQHHHHSQQQQHVSSRAVVGCSPTKHHHSKHASDPIKSSKGTNLRIMGSFPRKFVSICNLDKKLSCRRETARLLNISNFDDMFSLFDGIPVCNRQTNGHTSFDSIVRAMHSIAQ